MFIALNLKFILAEQQVHTNDKDVFKDAQLAKTPHQETLLLGEMRPLVSD